MMDCPQIRHEGQSFNGVPAVNAVFPVVNAEEVEKMRRTLVFLSIFLLTLVAVRGVSAAPQGRGSSTLSGVVLGPDDRPVAHAYASYHSSRGGPPHGVRADSQVHVTRSQLTRDNSDVRP